jgi:hypothetical protein
MIEREGETRWCTGVKNILQSGIQEGVTATTAAIPTKEGRRRRGAGQGYNKVEEDYNWGACDCLLDAANARAKDKGSSAKEVEEGHSPQLTHSSFRDRPGQA